LGKTEQGEEEEIYRPEAVMGKQKDSAEVIIEMMANKFRRKKSDFELAEVGSVTSLRLTYRDSFLMWFTPLPDGTMVPAFNDDLSGAFKRMTVCVLVEDGMSPEMAQEHVHGWASIWNRTDPHASRQQRDIEHGWKMEEKKKAIGWKL